LWNITWDNGGNELGYDVAVDSQGYVYVTGSNGTSYPTWDVLLLKFNSSGEQEWVRTWDSGDYDASWSLKIDSLNNIYIAGQTKAVEGDLLLLKYDSSGVYKWNSTFGGPNGQHGYDLALDSSNNIFVAGVDGPNPDFSLLLVKFDNAGTHLWNRTWGGTGNDQGFGVVLDSGNGVYITGWTTSFGALNKDMVVVKYDTSGNWQWNRTWGTSFDDEAQSIGVDSADNIYMSGHTKFANVSIVKYSASGEFLWDKQWGNTPTYQYWGLDLVIDSFDKIYITGRNRTGVIGIYDLFLAKLSIEPPPGDFTLSSNAGSPDDDGAFTLTWTSSSGANNYSIYQHSSYITDINVSLTKLANETNSLSLPLSGYSNGSYYFVAKAINNFGIKTSNVIMITVEIPDGTPDTTTPPGIPGFNLIIVGLVTGIVSLILIKRKSKLK
jgi:hypothetical protein